MFPDTAPLLYARGFCLSATAVPMLDELDHYTSRQLHGHMLYTDEVVETDIAEDGSDWAVIVGKAFPLSTGTLPTDGASLAEPLLRFARDHGLPTVEEALYDLGGRYALLIALRGNIYVYNDACATRSVYFTDSATIVCSHLDMIARISGVIDATPLYTMNVQPERMWESTKYRGIKSLLANHTVHLPSGLTYRFYPTGPNRATGLSHEERLATVRHLWEEQLDQIIDGPHHGLASSVTGGLDSRTMLALAGERIHRFQTMTYTTANAVQGIAAGSNWGRVLEKDYLIVQLLERFLPEGHRYITRKPGTWPAAQEAILDRNSAIKHGRWILFGYSELFPDRRAVHYRGNLLEIGRLHMRTPKDTKSAIARLEGIVFGANSKYEEDAALLDYTARAGMAKLGYRALPEGYDPTDMWYWELRHSRWYNEVLNETDIVFDTVSPVNCRRILDIFLSYSEMDRNDAFFQQELIYNANPYLMLPGINSLDTLYRQFVSSGIPRPLP